MRVAHQFDENRAEQLPIVHSGVLRPHRSRDGFDPAVGQPPRRSPKPRIGVVQGRVDPNAMAEQNVQLIAGRFTVLRLEVADPDDPGLGAPKRSRSIRDRRRHQHPPKQRTRREQDRVRRANGAGGLWWDLGPLRDEPQAVQGVRPRIRRSGELRASGPHREPQGPDRRRKNLAINAQLSAEPRTRSSQIAEARGQRVEHEVPERVASQPIQLQRTPHGTRQRNLVTGQRLKGLLQFPNRRARPGSRLRRSRPNVLRRSHDDG